MMISLEIKARGHPIRDLPSIVDVDLSTATAESLYARLSAHTQLSQSRIRLTKGSDGSILTTKRDDNVKDVMLEEFGLRDGSVVFVKDLGPQMGWRTVYVVEYLGPAIIHPLCLYLRPYIYSTSVYNPFSWVPFSASLPIGTSLPPVLPMQYLLCLLVTLHYLKREYETLYVHRFSAATMPLRNIFRNSGHYWVLSGVNLAYFFYRPTDSSKAPSPFLITVATLVWIFAEISNFHTHITLRDLRPADGSLKRQIPMGYGFNMVTCPNYLFESLAWAAIWVISGRNWAMGLFWGVGNVQMYLWAQKKERRYRKEFGSRYQKKNAMFPGIA